VLNFPWKVFSMTGNIDTYLLMKEMERDNGSQEADEVDEELMQNDAQ